MKVKKGSQKLEAILKGLADYTVYHFDYKKNLFETHGYPETTGHLKIHEDLVSQVLELKTQFEEGKTSQTIGLINFLTDWLRNHIMKTDKKYVPFLKEKCKKFKQHN